MQTHGYDSVLLVLEKYMIFIIFIIYCQQLCIHVVRCHCTNKFLISSCFSDTVHSLFSGNFLDVRIQLPICGDSKCSFTVSTVSTQQTSGLNFQLIYIKDKEILRTDQYVICSDLFLQPGWFNGN